MSALRKIIVGGALLALAGCSQHGAGPAGAVPIVSSAPRPGLLNPQPVRSAPADGEQCVALQGLGTSGTPDQYRALAAMLSQSADDRIARTAIELLDATGTSLDPVDSPARRMAMLDRVLDLDEECLRVAG